MEIQELKTLIQETVIETMLEVLKKERLALCLALIPRVSDREMREIEKQFGSPSDYDQDEFINMTDWVRNGTKLQ